MGYLYGAGPPEPFAKPAGVREEYVCWMSGKIASPNCPHKVKELVIAGTGEPEVCDLPHDKDFHYYLGASYAQWLDRKETEQGASRFRLVPPDRAGQVGASAARQPSSKRSRVEIVSPHNFDRFVMTSHSSGRVLFRAVPSPVVSHVVWMLDGMEIASTPPPYEFSWQMTRGRHVVHAITPNRAAAEITIHVE
jgi:penicillin-binding protein 1C